MVIIILALLSLCALVAARHYFSHSSRHNLESPRLDAMSAVKAVLEPPKTSLQALLTARAGSNERLRRSFQLTNTFVSDCPDHHRDFITQARALVNSQSNPHARSAFAELCRAVVDDYLDNSKSRVVPFDDFIQVITFKVILSSLFAVGLTALEADDVLFVARGINVLWQASKQSTPPPVHLLPTIKAHLHNWLPTYPNPLDFIIPTYETMWRVVAVTAALVRTHRNNAIVDSFNNLLDDPSRQQFQYWPLNGEPSAEAVIHEAMRLHPPTRRISRKAIAQAPDASSSEPSFLASFLTRSRPNTMANATLVADIGCLQRDPDVWGPSATSFDPSRFHPDRLTETQKQCMLGFGYGRLKCVAKDWAPLTAALIAAAVLSKCRGDYEIMEGANMGGREGWGGWEVVRTCESDHESM